MGKESLIESARQGLKSTAEFVKTKPKTVLFTGGVLCVSGLGLSAADGNGTMAILNTITLTIHLGAAGALGLKNSKTSHQESGPQNNP